ncbi:heat stress transcription factor A-4b-like [Zingiber officinale]|uniref:HSF-type DNA-binding domain-containing protein n=1 Tax=Zingiber officinale TaxID=94328 RepID=A0A8J5HXM1_ZINOF|nr:heat stress transcription factor A-4b-like [Zingiber officinale]KAG6522081.1 hypothetical protein ZIOFF_019215 [Zingiber officinale]
MEDARGSSNSPPPFLLKTYDMVDDPSTDSIVSWSASDASFVVWSLPDFSRDLLPKYFKHNNFSSFVRQLNTYGFRKIDPDRWEFANEYFVREQRHLLRNIYRRKPVHSHSNPSSSPLAEAERQELNEEIERLKQERLILLNELQMHTYHYNGIEQQIQSLEDRLQAMENRQGSLVAYLKRVIQEPQFLSELQRNKKRRLPKIVFLEEDSDSVGDPQMVSLHAIDMGAFEKMESPLNSLENIFRGVGQAFEDMFYDSIVPFPLDVISTEMNASTAKTSKHLRALLPDVRPSSAKVVDIHPFSDITKCKNQTDSQTKVSTDMKSEPTATEVYSPRNQNTNDGFWEQFLTEVPGSSGTQGIQSKGKDSDSKPSAEKLREQQSTCWNWKDMDHLAVNSNFSREELMM